MFSRIEQAFAAKCSALFQVNGMRLHVRVVKFNVKGPCNKDYVSVGGLDRGPIKWRGRLCGGPGANHGLWGLSLQDRMGISFRTDARKQSKVRFSVTLSVLLKN